MSGSNPWGRVDAPQMSGWVWKFSRSLLISFPASFVKRISLLNAFLGLPLSGSYPWGREDAHPPDVRVGLKILQIATYIITSKFCKKNFTLKCIPGLALVRVLPLGQGGRPPDVRVGLEIFQNATYIISSKFCKHNFALKWIPGPLSIGVLPLGQGGRPPDVRMGLEILQITTYIISSKFC